MSDYKHMLIDGKNAVYRAIFAGYYDERFRKSGYDYFVILVRFISNYIMLLKPDRVHILWDASRDNIWRKKLFPTYKDHRANKYKEYDINVHEELAKQVRMAVTVFQFLSCRQYYRPEMEADDLIYAFCLLNPEKTVIVSSDQDFRQITYKHDHVHIYNPLAKKQQVEPKPDDDIVVMKALAGDKSDNISGYYNIGEVKSRAMSKDLQKRNEFLQSKKAVVMVDGEQVWVGDEAYKTNRRMIDLSWCPYLAENSEYVEKKQQSAVEYDQARVEGIIRKNRIRGLLADLPRYISQFKNLI